MLVSDFKIVSGILKVRSVLIVSVFTPGVIYGLVNRWDAAEGQAGVCY